MLSLRPSSLATVPLVLFSVACGQSPQEPGLERSAPDPVQNAVVPGENAGITVPASGSTDSDGTFQGTLTIIGAAVNPAVGPVIVVRIHGVVLEDSGGNGNGNGPLETVTLNFAPVEMAYDRMETDEECIELELDPPSAFDAETKTTVDFDPSVLSMTTLPGPGDLLADLICANYESVVEGMWDIEESGQT